ncbi:MAG: hypothetical protein A2Y21_03475 [Clostridiales bacterium GWC2_40_7]|nr:MAG: hypothetical protein A2Y21_03475 [Clostridiales bacterium GWC2_40_7]
MTYDFLKDFHRRAEIVAIVDFITTRVSRKTKFREYELDVSEAINLVMLVLCFIMEKSLVEETCTKNDVAGFIRRLDIDYLRKSIPDEEYLNIADYLIKDCLQNSGIPHYFSTYNFETDREEKVNVKLIDDRRVSVGNESVYSYYMTPQGYKFMFNTLEIEDAMKVSIEQFKLGISIKKRNFNAARNNVDSLFNISKTHIQRINYFIKRVKEDIGGAGIEEYEKIYNSTFSSINEQKEGYNNLYELIGKAENSIMESNQASIGKETLNKEIENITYIKNRLKLLINEQSNLLLKQQELQKIYNEAVDNILYIGFENRLNFEEAVTKKMEENPALAYPLIKVLRPLFRPELDKLFNIKKAFKEQRIAGADTASDGGGILMSQRYFSRFESENDIRIRNTNERYLDIFEIICKNAASSPGREILLSELVSILKNDYCKLVPDLKILTNVLLQLSSIKEVDFTTIKNQKGKTVFNPSETFDIKYCVLELLNRDKSYNAISNLKILLSRNETVFIPERQLKENDMVTGLKCPDILFRIEVKVV